MRRASNGAKNLGHRRAWHFIVRTVFSATIGGLFSKTNCHVCELGPTGGKKGGQGENASGPRKKKGVERKKGLRGRLSGSLEGSGCRVRSGCDVGRQGR